MYRECQKCKTNEFASRAMVMMINECGHPLCQNCVETIFSRNVNRCPQEGCGKMLKKSNFWVQTFDDPAIEKETFIRKRLSKIYNLQEDDFPTLRAYNDYLEHFEDIIFKLAQDLDVEQTEAEIKQFKEQHAEAIERNRKRPTPDDIWIQKMLDEESSRSRRLNEEIHDEKDNRRSAVLLNPKAIIDELRDSDLPAEAVLDRQRKLQIEAEMLEKETAERKKREKQERQRQRKDRVAFGPLRVSGKAYLHAEPVLELNGPRMPSTEELEQSGFLRNVRKASAAAMAGGYLARIGCARALLEARVDIFNGIGA